MTDVKFRRKKLPGHKYENLEIGNKHVGAKVHSEDTNTIRKGRRLVMV